MRSQEIRSKFLEFFQNKSHSIVPSAPMVVKDDPTLMFTNAGMNQFKEFFLGNGTPKSRRIADTQKCLRVSGKHNDLEEVGKDTYHHTMFEMLGNWSFGDYFKKEAITWAWELLTEVYKLNKEDLYVSVFEGNAEEDLPLDKEALELWKNLFPKSASSTETKKITSGKWATRVPADLLLKFTLIYVRLKRRLKTPGSELVNNDHPLVVEIWNLVFIQFNRKADGSLEKLPEKHVDTGMGFERLCMALQGVKSNYDTDVFTPLIKKISEVTNSDYGNDEETDIAIRVIADHVRAVSFAIADGQLPGSGGAGYVIRRILRRAIRYGFTFLNQKEAFVYKLVDTLANQMGEAFPELRSQQNLITNVIREEENSFLRTLDQGLVLLDQIMKESKDKNVSGKKAFELYDTYGFPIDLTALILSEKGYSLDQKGFEEELQKQKDRSRNASKVVSGDWQVVKEAETEGFVGYDSLEADVEILRYRKVESKKEGELYQLVFSRTPFYPEGGGQVGDKGILEAKNGAVIYILDTRKENNLIIHLSKELPEDLSGTFTAKVNAAQRARTAANHSATHLLHQALREILGTHVEQKGSMVQSDYLRFDFSHFSKVSAEELQQIEDFVNSRIAEKLPLIDNREMTYQEAINDGAIALFGEKYGDKVRAVRFGKSMELCGGTHVGNTSDIWHFKIISEGAVASGIRRIEAITNEAAREYFADQTQAFSELKAVLKNAQDPVKAVVNLQEENAELKKQIESLLRDKAKNLKGDLKSQLKEINGVNFLAQKVDLDMGGIKDLSFQLGDEVDNLFLLFGAQQDEKAMLSCYISKNLVEKKGLNAGKVVKELGRYIQGGGGGQPFYATAGGKNPAGLDEALQKAEEFVK
jgi:alanyl-tRNA synthetase